MVEPDRLQDFYREVVTWKRLSHPNILELIGVMADEKKCSMVSPWMENGSIVEFLRGNSQANPLKLVCACSILCITLLTPVTASGRHARSSLSSWRGSRTRRSQRSTISTFVSNNSAQFCVEQHPRLRGGMGLSRGRWTYEDRWRSEYCYIRHVYS